MQRTIYRETGASAGFFALMALLGALVLAGLGSAWYMEHHGHVVTGMNNQVVWGTPHVFAVFLIVSASGALNVASMASVFSKAVYKPMARMSGLLAIALLLGGLSVLVLDLGRPERLIVAMTSYNFKSIFAWNIFLYTGFMVITGAYLFVQMNRGSARWVRPMGTLAFVWRLALTTGTGSIFGFLVARQWYDAAVMAPMFIAMSLSFGMAIFILVIALACRWTGRPLGLGVHVRLGRVMGIMAAAVLYFTAVHNLTNLYATEHHGVEWFILADGGVYTRLFWFGQVILGGLVPLALVFSPAARHSRAAINLASVLVIAGGFAQLYVIIIGGQAYPLSLFPGMEVASSFRDGVVAAYAPSMPEIGLGVGGVALALAVTVFGMKVLRFLPETLADEAIDPHFKTAAKAGA